MSIVLKNISWSVDDVSILKNISLTVNSGEIIGLIGPNGCGKTSLLRLMYRLNKSNSGVILLNKRNINKMDYKQFARKVAVVSQEQPSDLDYTVNEVVMMGRLPYIDSFIGETGEDRRIVMNAIKKVGLNGYSERIFNTLSGGEKKLTLIARALAQKAKILILDEPVSYLDIHFQRNIMELIKSLHICVVIAIHDLNLALHYCDKIILLNRGRVVEFGKTDEILIPSIIRKNFGVTSSIINKNGGKYILIL